MATGIHWRFWERERDDCAAIEPLLSLYADGMASPAQARRVEAHLGDCVDCREALEWMRTIHRVVADRPAVAPPPELRARIARAIAELDAPKAPARPARRPLTLRPALGYGLAALAAVGWGLWNLEGPAHVAVGVKPRPVTVAVNNRPPAALPAPVAVPSVPVKRSPNRPTVAPTVASRETPNSSRAVVRRHLAAPAAAPGVMTASADTGRAPTPPRISPLKTPSHLTVTRRAPHAVPVPQGPLVASSAPPARPRRSPVRPPHTEAAPLVASLPPAPTTPEVPTPSVRVLSPTVTPDQVRTASVAPSLNDTLSGMAVYVQRKAVLAGRGFAANSRTVAANFSVATADSSGTANITEGPVR